MKDAVKKNIPLVAGIAIPVIMIIAVAISIYTPRLFASPPQYSFLYGTGGTAVKTSSAEYYRVENGKLIKDVVKADEKNFYYPYRIAVADLVVYDYNKKESREITFEEAQKLELVNSNKSPDGFEVACGNSGGGDFIFFFGSRRDCSKRFIVNDFGYSQKLNLILKGAGYNNFYFLGWIKHKK